MKKIILSLLVILFVIPFGCKKGQEETKDEVSIAKKYARYKTVVYNDKELIKWLATLEKAEEVDLIARENHTSKKGKQLELAKVKLADDTVGYLELKHLAEKPVIFMIDTKALVRPTSGSKIHITIPKGAIGFIIGEKATWAQVYIGKIKGIWVTKQWVKGGYSEDENIIQKAKEFETAVLLLENDKSEKKSEGKEKLVELSNGVSLVAEMAKDKLTELGHSLEEKIDENEHGAIVEDSPEAVVPE